jgi:hypothetical protein
MWVNGQKSSVSFTFTQSFLFNSLPVLKVASSRGQHRINMEAEKAQQEPHKEWLMEL